MHQLQQALRAKELFKNDVDYIVSDGEVKIVDEFTGRILEGRRWSEGLHQAVEAKENVKIKEENQTLATVTIQNYFRMYDKLGGMTGTASTEAGEFAHTYDLQVVSIPTNRPMVRDDGADFIYKGEDGKYDAAVEDIVERHEQRSARARRHDLRREVGEAVAPAREAGHPARGAEREAARAGGRDHHAGRPARRPSPSPRTWRAAASTSCSAATPKGSPAASASARASWSAPTSISARYNELLPRFKEECKVEGDKVRDLGGLYVLGTERHESRRIDNQLRGRSGRQGDPGESRFYLSLEDELMRLFATGLMQRVMGASFPDDLPLESKMVSKAVERAQRTVEDRNFEIRKNVLKYDEVMNEQRKVIYRRRQQILDGEDLREAVIEAIERAIGRLVDLYCDGEFVGEVGRRGAARRGEDVLPDARHRRSNSTTWSSVDEAEQMLLDDARRRCTRRRKSTIGDETLRDIERRVMLSVLDQHWREHLYEMDYLQEGINLRAMGQQDPLSEWQREGFDMFEAMMGQIEDDFVRYVFHLQVVVDEQPEAATAQRAVQRGRGPGAGLERRCARPPRREPRSIAGRCRRPWPRPHGGGAVAENPSPAADQQPVRVEKTPGSQRAVLLRQRQEVQDLPRALKPDAMRDFSEDLAELVAPCARRARVPAHRRRAQAAGRARGGGRATRSLGRPRPARARSRRSMSRVRDDVELVDELDAARLGSRDAVRARRARRATTRSKARSPTGVGDAAARPRPARAARAVQRRARRARRDLRSPLRRGRHRRAGLGRRCCCACTRAGREPKGFDVELDEIARRPGGRHHVGDVHRRRAATRTGCSQASAACTG